jgi:hypothetical protein
MRTGNVLVVAVVAEVLLAQAQVQRVHEGILDVTAHPALVRPIEFVGGRKDQIGVGGRVDVLALEPLGLDAEVRLFVFVGWTAMRVSERKRERERCMPGSEDKRTAALSPKITDPIC